MKKILVVDDEMVITEGLLELFRLDNVEASSANDRESAEAMISREFYPLILADLRLRTVDEGLKLLESIKHLSPLSRVASMTGFATPELESEMKRLGASIVLHKPMEFEEIVAALEAMIEEIESAATLQQEATGQALDLDGLYQDVRKLLFSIPQRRYGFSADEAEEMVQQAWCLYLQKQQAIQQPRAWLAGTMANLCKQGIQTRMREREQTTELPERDEVAFSTSSDNDSVMIIRQALARLDERSRRLCILIGMNGCSYEEVSEKLDLALGSVGPLYIRAKNRLRQTIETGH
jgi:RNA polymerase sigma-70 factor (ECF subfamily)